MPRKLFARMDLEDRDPDGFKFPSNQNNNRARKSKKGKNKNATEHDENKMRGGLQFRDDGEVTTEDTTVFDAYVDVSDALARGGTRARLGTRAGPGRGRVEEELARGTPRAMATRGNDRAVVDMAVGVTRASRAEARCVGVCGRNDR